MFSEWLMRELNSRHWSQSDLARKSGITRGSISHILNGTRKAGNDVCEGIARAFGYPPAFVFEKAGLISDSEKEMSEQVERLALPHRATSSRRSTTCRSNH